MNENKNQLEVSKEKLEKLGILKILSVSIGEKETNYRCITEEGEIKFISASKLKGV